MCDCQNSLRTYVLGVINVPEINYDGEIQNINQSFRRELDLYANVVKIKSLPGVRSLHQNLDMVIIREQTEGEYSALEHESIPGMLLFLKVLRGPMSENYEIS